MKLKKIMKINQSFKIQEKNSFLKKQIQIKYVLIEYTFKENNLNICLKDYKMILIVIKLKVFRFKKF